MDDKYAVQLQRFALAYLKEYLEPGSYSTLLDKARSLKNHIQKEDWTFVIPRDHPLTFIKNDSNLQIDINCIIEVHKNSIKKYNTELRVLSIEDNPEVIFKFHIDQKDPKLKDHPWYHLQMEDSPRFPFPPMDIILLCEFVLVNFFHKKSEDLRKDSGWRNIVINSQHIFQKEYYHICKNCIDSNPDATLMEHLLNFS